MHALSEQHQPEVLIVDIDIETISEIGVWVADDGKVSRIDHAIGYTVGAAHIAELESSGPVLVGAQVVHRSCRRLIVRLKDAVYGITEERRDRVVLLGYHEVLDAFVVDTEVL